MIRLIANTTMTQNQVATTINEIWVKIGELRNFIENEVKNKGCYEIPLDNEEVSPTICYNCNACSIVKKFEWDMVRKDVLIYCEDGTQYLNECNSNDILILAETIKILNESDDDEFDEDWWQE